MAYPYQSGAALWRSSLVNPTVPMVNPTLMQSAPVNVPVTTVAPTVVAPMTTVAPTVNTTVEETLRRSKVVQDALARSRSYVGGY